MTQSPVRSLNRSDQKMKKTLVTALTLSALGLTTTAFAGYPKNEQNNAHYQRIAKEHKAAEQYHYLKDQKKKSETPLSQQPLFGLSSKLFITAISADRYPLAYLLNDDPGRVLFGVGGEMDLQQTFGSSFDVTPAGTNQTGTTSSARLHTGSSILRLGIVSAMAKINDWVRLAGVLEMPGDEPVFTNALVNLGNLKRSPWYVAVGNTRVDFGYFEGNSTLTNTLFNQIYRTGYDNSQVTLGYYNTHISNTTTVYQPGTSYKGQRLDVQFADLLVLRQNFTKSLNGLFNIGYINDLRGTGNGFTSSVNDFSQNTSRTNALTLGTSWTYKHLTGFFIYNSTLKKQQITNNHLMNGITFGGNYVFPVYGKSTNFMIDYTHMNNAQHIQSGSNALGGITNLIGVENNLLAAYMINITPNFMFTLEYNMDQTYNRKAINTFTLDFLAYL